MESAEQKTELTTVTEMNGNEERVSPGAETDRGFLLDNALHTEDLGDIHFNLYVPESYDGSRPYALHLALPGWEGLYFQGVGEDLRWEQIPFESPHYIEGMIVVSAQLSDWGETSARQAIALTEYLLSTYNIDPSRVFLTGYSGGGETGSIVMGMRPELYTAYLMVSSKWDGNMETLAAAHTPVYLVTGEADSYYGSAPMKRAYAEIHALYEEQGLSAEEIDALLMLDVKQEDYFTERGYTDQHAGGMAIATDEEIMNWLFGQRKENTSVQELFTRNGRDIPEALEVIPDAYRRPAEQAGTLIPLEYETWESFTYEQRQQKLTKTAWVYLPYGYDESQKYNIFYLSHGGWSNEETVLGTSTQPSELKYAVDHAIQDGRMKPLILVCPTYNNTGARDSWDYSLAIRLTDRFHNELMNDLIPAVEGRYHTWADGDPSTEGLRASRDHRGFGGFSMGSVNTWHTFQYCLDYFRYFMPMSGNMGDGQWIDAVVRASDWTDQDFFIWTATGTEDFAASGFAHQIRSMVSDYSGTFHLANNEVTGNVSYRLYEGGTHGPEQSDQYTFNALLWFWNP